MIHLLIYLLAAFGVAFVVGYSEVSLPIRERLAARPRAGIWAAKLMECPACLGFHIGWAYAVGFRPEFLPSGWGAVALLAFATAGSNLILGRIVGLIKS